MNRQGEEIYVKIWKMDRGPHGHNKGYFPNEKSFVSNDRS